jgi:hypothetical protein
MDYFDKTFTNITVRLDGNHYRSCTFRNCIIEFGGLSAGTAIEDCSFFACSWAFVDAAADTIRFMETIYANFGPDGKELIERTFEGIRRGERGAPPHNSDV